jgi:hypothetical protein
VPFAKVIYTGECFVSFIRIPILSHTAMTWKSSWKMVTCKPKGLLLFLRLSLPKRVDYSCRRSAPCEMRLQQSQRPNEPKRYCNLSLMFTCEVSVQNIIIKGIVVPLSSFLSLYSLPSLTGRANPTFLPVLHNLFLTLN